MASKKPKQIPRLTWKLIRSDGSLVLDSESVQAMHMVVTLPDGAQTRVELFLREERSSMPQGLRVTTVEGTLLVEPEASNTVKIINDTYIEREKRARARSR